MGKIASGYGVDSGALGRSAANAIGRSMGDAEGTPGGRGGGYAGLARKKLKKKEDTTSGTTGDPDNPTLDELRAGLGEPVYDRFVEGGRRRRRTVMSLDGNVGDLKRFLGG